MNFPLGSIQCNFYFFQYSALKCECLRLQLRMMVYITRTDEQTLDASRSLGSHPSKLITYGGDLLKATIGCNWLGSVL